MLFYISSILIWAPSFGAQTGISASERLWIHHWKKYFLPTLMLHVKQINFSKIQGTSLGVATKPFEITESIFCFCGWLPICKKSTS